MSDQDPNDVHQFLVATRMLAGQVVPFLGAGANLCGRPTGKDWLKGRYLPSGSELARELIASVKYPDTAERDLMRISQYAAATMGTKDLYTLVREPFDVPYPPTELHRFLARMSRLLGKRNKPRQVILTTNYDDLLECAFDAMDPPEPYDLIWYEAKDPDRGRFMHRARAGEADGEGSVVPIKLPNEYAELDPDERTVIVKLHGAMIRGDENRDSYVITEDDYIRYLTGADVAGQLPAVVQTRIKESHVLFLGYSMRDWNLRVVLERLGGDEVLSNRDWSVQLAPESAAETLIEERLWRERKIDLRFMLLDAYVKGLSEQVKLALDDEAAKALARERAIELARLEALEAPPAPAAKDEW